MIVFQHQIEGSIFSVYDKEIYTMYVLTIDIAFAMLDL